MRRSYLSQYFQGVAVKRLRAVEVDSLRSNQHEIQGVRQLRNILGDTRITNLQARFLWLSDDDGITTEGRITWYDARKNQAHRSAEYRLYFTSNPVMDLAKEGNLIFVAKRTNQEELFVIVVAGGSTFESQLLWLFGLDGQVVSEGFAYQSIAEYNPEISFAFRYILDALGLVIEDPDASLLDSILEPYLESGFPKTWIFSKLARESVTQRVSPKDDPDITLVTWLEQEERLFKRLEWHLVAKRLKDGFCDTHEVDVEDFIAFSLSIHNRRKSRAGFAVENHLQELFDVHNISYSRTAMTEHRSKPDFIFPSIEAYNDLTIPEWRLTMLGVKSTAKDRWRQVLSEAARINHKHLFTLEPSISQHQMSEMRAHHLQLVIPQSIHHTYKPEQQKELMNLASFIKLVKERQ